MEYLTLQDIPHRHCNPVHSHRMASQSSERPVGHMAAVCPTSFHSTSFPNSPCLSPPYLPSLCYAYAYRSQSLDRAAVRRKLPSLKAIELPALPKSPSSPPAQRCPTSECKAFYNTLNNDMAISQNATLPAAERKEYVSWSETKTSSQNHLQRSSPPLQPGEQQSFPGKLPSFDEVSIVPRLLVHRIDVCSSSNKPSREHHHTHLLAETTLRKTLRMWARSLMM